MHRYVGLFLFLTYSLLLFLLKCKINTNRDHECDTLMQKIYLAKKEISFMKTKEE
jgi:hypothetical protein